MNDKIRIQETKNQIPDILYHYTSLSNLTNIIRKDGEKVEMVFWLTNVNQMNDVSEGKILKDTLVDLFPELSVNNIPDMYVLSLCGSNENLPLWREYADDARGVVLALDRDVMLNNTNDFRREIIKCKYDWGKELTDLRNELQTIHDTIASGGAKDREDTLFNYDRFPELKVFPYKKEMIMNHDIRQYYKPLLAFKDPHFYYEDEYRLIDDMYNHERIKYRVRNGRMIEFREYHISINALKGIYIGPNSYDDVEMFVRKFIGHLILENHIDISKINIPYKNL